MTFTSAKKGRMVVIYDSMQVSVDLLRGRRLFNSQSEVRQLVQRGGVSVEMKTGLQQLYDDNLIPERYHAFYQSLKLSKLYTFHFKSG